MRNSILLGAALSCMPAIAAMDHSVAPAQYQAHHRLPGIDVRFLAPVIFSVPGTAKVFAGPFELSQIGQVLATCKQRHPGKDIALYVKRGARLERRKISVLLGDGSATTEVYNPADE